MSKAQKMGKWAYSGLLGVSLALAALTGQIHAPWTPQEPETLSKSAEPTAPQTPIASSQTSPSIKFSNLAQAQSELANALSWNELRSFPSGAYKDLVQQLAQEEFENGTPFVLSQQRTIWSKVLSTGLKDYSRKVYRSPHFQGRSGYDLVHYELLLGDGQKTHLLAYREKTDEIKVTIGGEDRRPTRIDLYTQIKIEAPEAVTVEAAVETSNEETLVEPETLISWRLQSFQVSGEALETSILNEQEFLASKEAIISLSVPLLTAGR